MKNNLIKLIRFCRVSLNKFFVTVFSLFPVNKNIIVLESEGDYWDNARAFYEYLKLNGYNKHIKIVWFVKSSKKYDKAKNVSFVNRNKIINIKANYYTAISGTFLFTHPYWLTKWRSDQTVINMTHSSMMLKAGGADISNTFDYMMTASNSVKDRKKKTYYIKDSQALILGAPRIDLLFQKNHSISKIIPEYRGEKLILGMSTFKNTVNWKDSDFPDLFALNVVKDINEMIKLNNYLKVNSMYLVIKIHHLQDLSSMKNTSLSQIIYLTDNDLQMYDIQLYHFVNQFDILLTDYSSIFYDFLILNRPIGFLVADINQYSRGFCIPDPLVEMTGELLHSVDNLIEFLENSSYMMNKHGNRMNELKNIVHEYQDDKNSKRLLEWLITNNKILLKGEK